MITAGKKEIRSNCKIMMNSCETIWRLCPTYYHLIKNFFAGRTLALLCPRFCNCLRSLKFIAVIFSVAALLPGDVAIRSAYAQYGKRMIVTEDEYRAIIDGTAPSSVFIMPFPVDNTLATRVVGHIDGIIAAIVTEDMSDDQKVKVAYDFLIFQYVHSGQQPLKSSRKIDYTPKQLNANEIALLKPSAAASSLYYADLLIRDGEGSCSQFAALFALLLSRMGIPCEIWDGFYVNRDGSTYGHSWNRAYVDGRWYWYDVDVEGTVYRRNGGTPVIYFLYKKDDDYWKTNHASMSLSYTADVFKEFFGSAITKPVSKNDQAYDKPPLYADRTFPNKRPDTPIENSIELYREQDYFETFIIPDRKGFVQVGDIRLQLTKTDVKKDQYNIIVLVAGNTIEKKNNKVNEPLRFFIGSDRVLYEVFINWVRKDSAGGYIRIH